MQAAGGIRQGVDIVDAEDCSARLHPEQHRRAVEKYEAEEESPRDAKLGLSASATPKLT